MLPRDQVTKVIRHEKPDRIPVYGWVRANLAEPIKKAFGSADAFEDRYEFDLSHIFGGPPARPYKALEELQKSLGRPLEPKDLLDVPMPDVDDESAYQGIKDQIRHHKEQRGRFVYVQTPGIFECLNGSFGIQNHCSLEDLVFAFDTVHKLSREVCR